jgi:predicted AlkP superfamily phosphohydrolase/phosphomutase
VAVLGLDGVPFSLLDRLCAKGITPNLASIARKGVFSSTETDHPAVSSVSWTSFMTGAGPGRHGIFGFTDITPGKRALRLPSFDDIAAPVLWAGRPMLRAVVVNLPFTYPARPLNGTLIAGFVAPIFERSVYPPSLLPWLKGLGYKTDVDADRARTDRNVLIRDLFETLRIHEDVMMKLVRSQPWDLFVGVVTGTDRLHHFLFDAAENESHPFHEDFARYYRQVDAAVGRLWDCMPPDALGIILSDHGFTQSKGQVYLNTILERLGRLTYARPHPRGLEDVAPSSVAFALDPNRIYLNGARRFPDGRVTPEREGELRAALKREIERLTLEEIGAPVGVAPDAACAEGSPAPCSAKPFAHVLVCEDIYQGPATPQAPDLIVVPAPGYDLRGSFGAPFAWNRDIFTGTHTHNDAFVLIDTPTSCGLPVPKTVAEVGSLAASVLGRRRI